MFKKYFDFFQYLLWNCFCIDAIIHTFQEVKLCKCITHKNKTNEKGLMDLDMQGSG